MSDKKNDDYGHRDAEMGDGGKVETAYSRSPSPRMAAPTGFNLSKIDNSPGASVLGYCLASISMTVVNKFVVSGSSWNMNFLYLAIQVHFALHSLSSIFHFALLLFQNMAISNYQIVHCVLCCYSGLQAGRCHYQPFCV